MSKVHKTVRDVDAAARYFSSFASDYHRAFDGTGENVLHRTLNRLFRRRTFELRTKVVEEILTSHGLAGKAVVDVGCGSGEVSVVAARLGAASVRGFDIVPDMIALARQQADASPFANRCEFTVRDAVNETVPAADVTLCVAVIEYYAEIAPFLTRLAQGTGELLVIVDTRGPLWRRLLRYGLARYKGFHLYYHPPADVARIITSAGFTEVRRVALHSSTVMAFRRMPAASAAD